MAYETSTIVLLWLQDLLLFIALFFAAWTLVHLTHFKKKKEVIRIKKVVFAWLTAGLAFIAVAFLLNNIYSYFMIHRQVSSIDLFFSLGYICFALAFGYFWYSSAKLHTMHIREPVFIIGVASGIVIWLFYLFRIVILPGSRGAHPLILTLNSFYPIIVSIIFLLTLIIHPKMKAGMIRTPLWYISSGVFMYFFAFMIYSYSVWNAEADILPVIYSVLFLLSAGYFLLGFYSAHRKYA